MTKQIQILLIFFFTCVSTQATTYYISASGNDANNGTSTSTPFKTIAKLNSLTLSPGDNVYFNRGDVFTGNMVIHNSGNSSNPITIGAYGNGANPVITGFTNVTAWTNLGGNIWESSSAVSTLSSCNMVTVNGINTGMGRIPKGDNYYIINSFSGSSTTPYTITSSSLNSSVINWTGAVAIVRKGYPSEQYCNITAQSGSTITINDVISNGNPQSTGFGFFIQNDIRTLSVQNEWYYNPTTKKLDMYSTTSPTAVQLATISDLVTTSGSDYITFDGLTFTGANNDIFNFPGASDRIVIKNCNLSFCGNIGTELAGSNVIDTIYNCHFNDMGKGGIGNGAKTYVGYDTLLNMGIVHGQSNWGVRSNAIYLFPQGVTSQNDVVVEHCYVNGAGSDGIALGSLTAYGLIQYNHVEHALMTNTDNGGIYVGGNNKKAILIDHNIVDSCQGYLFGTPNAALIGYNAVGLYGDEGESHTIWTNNTSAYNGEDGFKLHSYTGTGSFPNSDSNRIERNTFFANGFNQFLIQNNNSSLHIIADTSRYNICFPLSATQYAVTINDQSNAVTNIGVIDSNYYCQPYTSANKFIQYQSSSTTTQFPLIAQWRTFSGFDLLTQTAPLIVSGASQIRFIYNDHNNDSTVDLLGINYKDAKNNSYSGSVVVHSFESLVLIQTTAQTIPTITWSPLTPITYGTALGASELNATSGGVTGTFAYTPGSGTILNAGVQNLSTVFTPQDQTTYSTASKTVPITVNQATATLNASNTTQTYTGFPLQPIITTSPTGLTVVNTTYNGVGQIPTNAGSYSCISGLTNTNYSASPISYTFTINKASVTIAVSNTTQTYTGSPLPVTVTTNPNVSGISVTYDGSATVPTNAGTYTVVASLSNTNYQASPVTTTLVINKATPTVSWSTPTAITYGTALSGTQLNATASVAGAFTYTPASGAILNTGTNVLSVDFAPTDGTDYNSVLGTTVSLVVSKATATISLSNLNQLFDGNPKPVTVTTSPVGLTVITTTYNGSTSAPSAVGSYPVISSLNNSNYTATPATGTLVISTSAANIFITNYANLVYNGSQQTPTVTCAYSYTITFNGSSTAPTNVGSYTAIATISDGIHSGADTVTMTIIKATPIIVWANPTAITYGTALSATQLNASSTVAGTFTYTPISGTLLNAGTYVLSTSFAPTDASNYNTATATVNLTVNKSSATLYLSNLNQVYDGTAKPVTVTSSPIGLSGITVLYNGSSSIPTNAGSYPITVSLNNANYSASNVTGTLVVAKASSILSWATPVAVQQGTALSATQLNATSTGAGTFTYSPNFGYVVQNNLTLNATFIPTDTVNYNTQTISVFLSVYGNPLKNYYIKHGKTIYLNQ